MKKDPHNRRESKIEKRGGIRSGGTISNRGAREPKKEGKFQRGVKKKKGSGRIQGQRLGPTN